jgi:predicted ATP-grasp superfamily ATP-dependent carboligase
MNSRPPAVVLGASVNGLSFARSLGRRGIDVLMLDSEDQIGRHTKYAEARILPSCREQPDVWLRALRRYAHQASERPVIFATSDAHNVFLASHADELSADYRFLVPDLSTMQSIVNKREQYSIAEQAGVPIPATFFPESTEELQRLLERVPFPCILKPYRAHVGRAKIGKKKVAVCEGPDELRATFAAVAGEDAGFMVQEIVPGGDRDLFGYLAFWGREGNEICWLTKRKLRQNPPLFGDGCLQVTVREPEVARLARKLLAGFDYRGFVGVEFKRDTRDGSFKLMEINPRTVSGNQMAITAGVDFPWIGYRYLLGEEIDPKSCEARPGVLYVNEEWDVKSFLTLRRQGLLTTGEWWRSFRSAEARSIYAPDDRGPALEVLRRFAAAGLRRLTGRR